MTFLFTAGSTAPRNDTPPPTPDAGLRVQTSAAGGAITFFHGQQRFAGNDLWYDGFAATAVLSQPTSSGGGGGKGGGGGGSQAQPQVTGYTYKTNTIFGLCEGPIDSVLLAWDSKTPESLSSLNVTAFDGSQGQPAWSFLTGSYPAVAINYSSLAYVGMDPIQLGTSSSLPNLNWEVRSAISKAVTETTTIGSPFTFTPTYFNLASSVVELVTVPPTGPFTVQAADPGAVNALSVVLGAIRAPIPGSSSCGVLYAATLAPLTQVGSSPSTGQYVVSGAGLYTFAAGDAGVAMVLVDLAVSPGVNYIVQPTGTTHINSTNVSSVSSLTGVAIGDPISGTNIPPGTVVQNLPGGGAITLSQPATANGTVTLTVQGAALVQVLGNPSPGCFSVSVQHGAYGQYTFSASDNGAKVLIIDVPDADPTVSSIDVLSNPRYGCQFPVAQIGDLSTAKAYFYAAGLFISPLFQSPQPATSYFQDFSTGLNCEFVWSSGLLTIVPYGDQTLTGNGFTYTPPAAPIYALNDDDFMTNSGAGVGSSAFTSNDPVTGARSRPSDALNDVKVEFLDRGHSYNPAIVEAPNDAAIQLFGLRPADNKQLHFFTSLSIAMTSAQLQLGRQEVRNQYSFTLPWYFIMLDPMDIIAITDVALGLNAQWVRILEITENQQDFSLSYVVEEYLNGTGAAPLYGSQPKIGYLPNLNTPPGSAVPPVIFEAPIEISSNAGLEIWLATGGGPNWGGATVWVSSNNGGDSTYQTIGVLVGGSRVGASTADFPVGADPDTTHSLAVSLVDVSGTMNSGTQHDADQGNTLCYIAGYAVPAAPMLGSVPGGSLAGATYFVRATYVFASGEGPPSAEDSFTVAVNNLLTAASPGPQTGATGWNIYVGAAAGAETKQASNIPIGTSWTEPTSGLITGTATPPSETGYELVSYETATLTGANAYSLGTYLRRGQYSTTITDHPSGSQFARLDQSIFKFPYAVSQIGQTIYVKLTSRNLWGGGEETLDEVQPYAHTIEGPPLPGIITGFMAAQVGNSVALSWNDLPVFGPSLKGYDILYGAFGDIAGVATATLLSEASRSTETTTVSVPPGYWTFYIRGHDIADQLGPVSTVSLNVISTQNAIVTQIAEPDWICGLDVNWGASGFILHYTGVIYPDSTVLASAMTCPQLFESFVPFPVANPTFTLPVDDTGFNDLLRVWFAANAGPGPSVTGSAKITTQLNYFLTGQSNPETFVPWTISTVTLRYAEGRITEDTSVPSVISSFHMIVDKPPVVQAVLNVPVGVSGTTILFANLKDNLGNQVGPFHTPPGVTVTPSDGTSTSGGASVLTATSAFLQLFNGSTEVAGSCTLHIIGA